jgi:hypothetical protein
MEQITLRAVLNRSKVLLLPKAAKALGELRTELLGS